jgi:hypothetical protein
LGKPLGTIAQPSSPVFSLNVKDEALDRVVEKISKGSGYKIILEGERGDFRVSADMENVTIEEALWRCLRDLNYAVAWNEKDRKITLFIQGAKGPSRGADRTREDIKPGAPVAGVRGDRGTYGGTEKSQEDGRARSPAAGVRGGTGPYRGAERTYDDGRPRVTITGEGTSFVQGTRMDVD